jgi:nucleoside-diphosphate-sugar epimerase
MRSGPEPNRSFQSSATSKEAPDRPMVAARQIGPVLVTGASGFVGNCVVRRLLGEGRDVHVLLRRSAKVWRLAGIHYRLQVHEVDVTNADAVRDTVTQIRPEAVLHLAAYGAYESQADARTILQTNITGTYNLLDASLAVGTKFFLNTGSSSEYGYRSDPMKESDRIEPNSIYAVAKAAQTHLCSLLAQNSATRIITFRLFSVYGPWEEPTRLIPTLIRRARAGEALKMVAAETARDFIYVDDVVDALLSFSILEEMNGEVFNLGTGMQSTMRQVVAAVQETVGSASPVEWGAMGARKWDTSCWLADPQKAKKKLRFRPRFSLPEGIRAMAAWMHEVGDDYGPR